MCDELTRIGLGVDAGGTYTDAVLYDLNADRVITKAKALTTKWDFTVGIVAALESLDPETLSRTELVAVSTTLATNAIVEGDGQKVGLLLMSPYGIQPGDGITYEPKSLVEGAIDITGKVRDPIDEASVREVVANMVARHGVEAFAVSGFGGSVNPSHELAIKQIIRDQTGLLATCGHELSSLLNFKTRADTAVLNARIIPRLVKLLDHLDSVLETRGVDAPVVVVKGDGTFMSRAMAIDRPVETILSGPAASVAGARFLTGHSDALVVDMGGTTTDTAALVGGEVEISGGGSSVGSAKTHVRALKIRTCGLGGDSHIVVDAGSLQIGPRRVAPLAWLAEREADFTPVLDDIERALERYPRSSEFAAVVALTGGDHEGLDLSRRERRLLELLGRRPQTIATLAARLEINPRLVPLSRLEETYVIQRCALTPTDLMHTTGDFDRWDAEVAARATELTAHFMGLETGDFIELVDTQMIKRLATELLKKQLEADDDLTVDPDAIETSPIGRLLLERMLAGASSEPVAGSPVPYGVSFQLRRPVIGIGAPIGHFLPRAATLLGADAVMPEHADVANAVGAITSHVVVERRIVIRPLEGGGFYLDGLPEAPRFSTVAAADEFARPALLDMVNNIAVAAGASEPEIEISHEDHEVEAAMVRVFIERIITASASGIA
ncbi:MAG: hydantoinase/oxoprolinase family protein [Actinomycetia bacterium]|nr:hydantoinase/oxoprolinase family protein [Actinomycetes bacterium]